MTRSPGSLFVLVSLLIGFAASANPVERLLELDHKPTITELKQELADEPRTSELANKGTPGLQAMIMTSAPAAIAAFEKAYPGATYAALGRDSSFLGDILDAFYQSQGQAGRVVRVNASGASRTNDQALIQFLKASGVDANRLESSVPFIMFDQTRYNQSSQSVSFLSAVYSVARDSGCSDDCMLNKFNFINTGAGLNQMYGQNVVGKTEVDAFFRELRVSGVPTGLLSVAVDHSLTYTSEYHDKFSAFFVDRDGVTKTHAGAMSPDSVRIQILADMANTIHTVSSPEFLADVRLEAFLLGYDFPSGRVMNAEDVHRIRAGKAPTSEQIVLKINSSIERGVREMIEQKSPAAESASRLVARTNRFAQLDETHAVLTGVRSAIRLREAGIFSGHEFFVCLAQILPPANRASAEWTPAFRDELRAALSRDASLEGLVAGPAQASGFEPLGLALSGEPYVEALAARFFASPKHSAASEATAKEFLKVALASEDLGRLRQIIEFSELMTKNGWNAQWIEPNVLKPAMARFEKLSPAKNAAQFYMGLAVARPRESSLRGVALIRALELGSSDEAILTAAAKLVYAEPKYLASNEASVTTLIRTIIASKNANLIHELLRFGQQLPANGWNPEWVRLNVIEPSFEKLATVEAPGQTLRSLRDLGLTMENAPAQELLLGKMIELAVAHGDKEFLTSAFKRVELAGTFSNGWVEKYLINKAAPKLGELLSIPEIRSGFPNVIDLAGKKFSYILAAKVLVVGKAAMSSGHFATMKAILLSSDSFVRAGFSRTWVDQRLVTPTQAALDALPSNEQISVHRAVALEAPEYTALRATSLGRLTELVIQSDDLATMGLIRRHALTMTGWNPVWIQQMVEKIRIAERGRAEPAEQQYDTRLAKAPSKAKEAPPVGPWTDADVPFAELVTRLNATSPTPEIWLTVLAQDRSKAEFLKLLDLFAASMMTEPMEVREATLAGSMKFLRAYDVSFQAYNGLRSRTGLKMLSPGEAGWAAVQPRAPYCRSVFR